MKFCALVQALLYFEYMLTKKFTLGEKCPNTKFFLVRIFLHSDWKRRFTSEYRKRRTRKNKTFGHFSRCLIVDVLLGFKSSVIRQKGEPQNGCFKKTKHVKFSEKTNILKNERFFGKFNVLCFLKTPVLRFAHLPYYRRNTTLILAHNYHNANSRLEYCLPTFLENI